MINQENTIDTLSREQRNYLLCSMMMDCSVDHESRILRGRLLAQAENQLIKWYCQQANLEALDSSRWLAPELRDQVIAMAMNHQN